MFKSLTKSQKDLLLKAQTQGYILRGSFGSSQHHRPANTLENLGLLRSTWVPEDSVLQTQGWVITEEGKQHTDLFDRRAQLRTGEQMQSKTKDGTTLNETEIAEIQKAVDERIREFDIELKAAVMDWIQDLDNYDYDYVGSRVEGPAPRLLTRREKIDKLMESINSWCKG